MKESQMISKAVPCGLLSVAVLCIVSLSSVNSLDARRLLDLNMPKISENETIGEGINATGEFIKRAGEFASRALWVRKGKFILPAGTILSIAPKITVPAFRRKAFKGGLNSDFQATWFFYLNADKMGLTHDMHPFPFDRPPFYPFGPLMRPIESKDFEEKNKPKDVTTQRPQRHPMDPSYQLPTKYEDGGEEDYKNLKTDAVYTFFPIGKRAGSQKQNFQPGHNRNPRSIMSLPPPEKFPGGERAVLLPSIENMMANFGFEGKGCLLRAICEIHEFPMSRGYGLLGEMITLFFSVSQSPYAESHMPEYLKAEFAGKSGNCAEYKKTCAKSVFKWEIERKQHDEESNDIPVSLYRSKYTDDEL